MPEEGTQLAIKQEKEQVATLVQRMLVKRLQKHEIDPSRAKDIARAVVGALKQSHEPATIEQVIPTLSTEFIELQEVIEQANTACRNDLEKKVTAFVKRFIDEGKFSEANKFAEDALQKLAARPFSCEKANQSITDEFDIMEHANDEEPAVSAATAPAYINTEIVANLPPLHDDSQQIQTPLTDERELVPIPKVTDPPTPQQPHVPENTAVQKMPPVENPPPLQTTNGADPERESDETVPIDPQVIPKGVMPPPVFEPATESFDRQNSQLFSDSQKDSFKADAHAVAEKTAKKTHSMGSSLESFGKKLLQKTEKVLFKQLDKLKEKYEHGHGKS